MKKNKKIIITKLDDPDVSTDLQTDYTETTDNTIIDATDTTETTIDAHTSAFERYTSTLSKKEIKDKFKHFKKLTDHTDLYDLELYKNWIRYYNIKLQKPRLGGILVYVDPKLRYIILMNIIEKITWSVQLKKNVIFVNKNPLFTDEASVDFDADLNKDRIKEALYLLYKNGDLDCYMGSDSES